MADLSVSRTETTGTSEVRQVDHSLTPHAADAASTAEVLRVLPPVAVRETVTTAETVGVLLPFWVAKAAESVTYVEAAHPVIFSLREADAVTTGESFRIFLPPNRLDQAVASETMVAVDLHGFRYLRAVEIIPSREHPRLAGLTPTVITLSATATDTLAALTGSVNPNGNAATWWFAWGTTSAYGNETTHTSAGSGSLPTVVSADVGGGGSPLTTGQTYHFALKASSVSGTITGEDLTFIAEAPAVPATIATIPAPFGSAVTIPHLAYPMRIRNTGADVLEQETLTEVFACVQAIADCPVGACDQILDFGVSDRTFDQLPVNTGTLIAEIVRQEPRAEESAVQTAIGDASLGQVNVALATASEGSAATS